MINPLLLTVPSPIITPRLLLRPPQAGDGTAINEAIIESFDDLKKWLPWANHRPSINESEIFARTSQAKWILREDLVFLLFHRETNMLLGVSGFHRINWHMPSFEIGYWIRSSAAKQGFVTESTNALTRYAFEQLNAARVEIKCDSDNTASTKVAEKLGFCLEEILINNTLRPDKSLRSTTIYARYDTQNLPLLETKW